MVYFILGMLVMAGSFAAAEDLHYDRAYLGAMDLRNVMQTALSWEEVERGQKGGMMSVVVTHPTTAFDNQHRAWIDIPEGAELFSVGKRCLGWMNAFIQAGYGGRENLYFREWDVHFHDKAGGKTFIGVREECQRPFLTREQIVVAQNEGLVQAFTNKVVTLHSEDGPMVIVGPRFRNRENFLIEWMSRSTTGVLKVPANRLVTLEGDPCRPVGQIKIGYAGGTYWVRALDLDIRMGGEKLAETPLGSGAWVLCD